MAGNRVACMFAGLSAFPPPEGDLSEPGALNLQQIVNAQELDRAYRHLPTQPDGSTHVWVVNSFAQPPVQGVALSEDVAQQSGFATLSGMASET